MRPVSAELAAFLDANTVGIMRHLVTVTLRGGTVYRWTDNETDLIVGGNTFYAGGQETTHPIVKVGQIVDVAGTEIGSCSLVFLCGETAMLGSVRFPYAAAQRAFDGAIVKVERVFGASAIDVSMGAMHRFEGPLGDVSPSSSVVEVDVESGIAALNVQIPRHVFQAGCENMLYDGQCGLVKGTWTVTGTVSSGATTTSIPSNRTEATGTTNTSGWFALGVLTFAAGTTTVALRGVSRAVRSYSNTGGTFTLDRPLSVAPVSGDTFTVYPGCPKTKAACENNTTSAGPAFNNLVHFRGEPFVPRNEAAL